ncbi:MAG: hypothetical protein ACLT98_11835 [Eggerthellaceae bacterium]
MNRDENVHGCLLFRLLPSFVDESHVRAADPKDIDGITLASLASVFTDGHAGYPPRRRPRAFSCSIITRCRSGQARRGGGTQPRRGKPRP